MRMCIASVAPDGQEVSDNETGEIWVRGPSVTPGYWNNPAANESAFTDGWLRTGDIAHSLTIEGIVRELYDVAILPGVAMPSALGFKSDEIRRTITLEE